MMRSARFWVPMALFQIVFGAAVFLITRQYYIGDSDNLRVNSTVTSEPSFIWPEDRTLQFESSTSSQSTIQDPVEISRQADVFFTNQQYDRAAELYEQLLAFAPNNVDTYNNLGITLHYLGRSTEALRRLNEGVAADPTHQRIWLTLGFVNGQLGDTEQARAALTSAAQIDADNEIGRSAQEMLENLP